MSATSRRDARVIAYRVIYQRARIGVNKAGEEILFQESSLPEQYKTFAKELINKTWEELEAIDQKIQENLKNWKQSRIAESFNALLRLSVCELLFFPETDNKVVINEAIEICRSHVEERVTKMCNGVLNAVWKS